MEKPPPAPPLPPDLREALDHEPDAAELARVWHLLGPPEAAPADERRADWAAVRAAIAPSARQDRPPARSASGRRPLADRLRRAAPVLALVLAAALAALLLVPRAEVLRTAPGETLAVTLPDGSSVELNAGSQLTYAWRGLRLPGPSARERRVRLDGEAYFAVHPDARRFVVQTAEAEVIVTGTRFNVRARAGAGTTVTLDEGRVLVAPRSDAGGPPTALSPGQAAHLAAPGGDVHVRNAAPEEAAAWRTGGFAVRDEPLWFILQELEHRYGTSIRLDNAAAASDSLTLYFPRLAEAETAVRDISTARNLRYRRTNGGFALY